MLIAMAEKKRSLKGTIFYSWSLLAILRVGLLLLQMHRSTVHKQSNCKETKRS